MQIAGSFTTLSPVRPEPSRDRSANEAPAPAVEARGAEAFAVEPDIEVEASPRVEEVAEARSPRPYPLPVRMSVDGRYANQAVAAYEDVLQLQRRDDLRAIMGVDLYA
ncbi:hypothetical protein ThidrDRAFT_1240 [Thiorhodococcus drewsii AZ1]|uniref:Uncharacterized protein n=1 Tax=Thiorhodococcus drewsii AZ1 TaxID=765913 RepID=G2DZ37_9GAMM|nr:hypothetical protein [Thiorhodococcus drewsii]EGV32391.1 hypothetical protein ThidrDRAFT_1240 [Thiorhodococcus drewsii AZ1]